jgi:hypothetical protein
MHYYAQHMRVSGAQAMIEQLLKDPQFTNDLNYRKLSLQSLQQLITQTPVDAALLKDVMQAVKTRFGNASVRFRSSSNTEDLAEFNGAGLYESLSAQYDDKGKDIAKAMTTVWGSLWNLRAFEERDMANVDQSQVAMAILIHPAFQNERANGVAVGRNPKDLTRTDQYYFNIQAGEASVTNPAPGVVTEQLIFQWPPRTPRLTYESFSSLVPNQRILTEDENIALACAMDAIQTHFKEKLDPDHQNRWFTIETEFKFIGAERQL